MSQPQRDRPDFPQGYGIATGDDGMLAWDQVAATVAAAPTFWLSTVRPDGRPHLVPIWGAFVGDRAWFEGDHHTRWAKNLAENPAIDVGIDHLGLQVMVKGRAAFTAVDGELRTAICDGYAAKYDYRSEGSEFFAVTPHTVLAWDTSTIDAFAATPTRFRFDSGRS